MEATILKLQPQNLVVECGTPVSLATLDSNELRGMNAYWRAANYLSVGQIYLYDNPLLREPLKLV